MSDVRTILLTAVQDIQDGMLLYRDEDGNAASIDLAACALRWGQAHPEAYPDPSKSRCVGERWILPAQGTAYYELYTAPQRTRLCFPFVVRWQDKLLLRIGLLDLIPAFGGHLLVDILLHAQAVGERRVKRLMDILRRGFHRAVHVQIADAFCGQKKILHNRLIVHLPPPYTS